MTMVVAGSSVPVLQGTGLHKSYGGVRALKGVDLALLPGEVHALCGENGSGKSTLLKILSAQIAPDEGQVLMGGEPVSLRSPAAALAAGIGTVTQERTLASELTVAENVLLGPAKAGRSLRIDWRRTRQRAQEVLDILDFTASPDTVVADLSPGQAQLVEIARALSRNVRVLILDEPTSSLTAHEVDSLFRAVDGLRTQGVATVFISHRTEEIFAISDRITVLRDGSRVSNGPVAQYSPESLVSDMLGRELSEFVAPPEYVPSGAPMLQVRELTVTGRFADVSLDVGHAEIVGIAGLVGAGHSEVLESLFGLHRVAWGSIVMEGATIAPKDPPAAISAGIGFVPGDRKINGLVLDMSVADNALMASTATRPRWTRPLTSSARTQVEGWIDDYGIVTESAEVPVVRLSGGNQQKVLIAKWIATGPRLLLLDEPTRGVDVGAKAEIYRTLLAQRDSGMSILISSSEIGELLTLCDRIIVMSAGRVVASLHKANADEATILRHAMGAINEEGA